MNIYSQLLCLQVCMLHTVLHHVISPPKGHANEITPNTVGYYTARLFVERNESQYWVPYYSEHDSHRLSIVKHLAFGNIITDILKYFHILKTDLTYEETKELRI